ncbi:hypothetical protein TNCV_3724911 [Trichonephila clavipes]|nr:hypothetical protein TNCV_3724911 [Trichonephila clavipes]
MSGVDVTASKNDKQAVMKFLTLEGSQVAGEGTWCHHFQSEVHQLSMDTSGFTQALQIQNSAVSWKGDVNGLIGQRFHFDDGLKAAVLN